MDIAITAFTIIILMLILKFIMERRAQKSQGKLIDVSIVSEEVKALLTGSKSILYFYTPTCGVCKTQSPIIDKLKEDLIFVGKIDLSANSNTQKEFGILGTPTTAIMQGNKVIEIFVGFKKYNFLKTKFETL
ncbi:MAG: thioredoxin family protein [Melioribacteraceae bacterium]|nr:thioredoxin family protein [Melioribacteraceae bacterium]